MNFLERLKKANEKRKAKNEKWKEYAREHMRMKRAFALEDRLKEQKAAKE